MRTLRISLAALSSIAIAGGTLACTREPAAPVSARRGVLPPIVWPASISMAGRRTRDAAEWLARRASPADSVGVVRGDSAVRLRLWPATDTPNASSQLCGATASGRLPRLERDTLALPTDTLLPALGRRRITAATPIGSTFGEPIGMRWIVPGAQAQYHFEGLTRDGAQRVSFRWPVRTDSTVRIPIGAPDSVIEAALQPSPDSLDAVMRRVVASTPGTLASYAPDQPAPRQIDAVPLVSDLPFFVVALPLACPSATFRVPMIARVEQRLRIPVRAGDEVGAFASVEYGAVQVAFEEAGLSTPATGMANVPQARVLATADGTVTLRLALQVVAKRQRSDQDVLVRLTRRHP